MGCTAEPGSPSDAGSDGPPGRPPGAPHERGRTFVVLADSAGRAAAAREGVDGAAGSGSPASGATP